MEYIEIIGIPYLSKGSGIHIKKENRGKFTETKKKTGKTTEELTHSKNPLTRKRAIFAQNAKKWKHEDGGSVHKPNGHRSILDNGWFKTKDLKKNHPLTYQQGGSFWSDASNVTSKISKRASDAYEKFSNSGWGTVYDIANAGLYAAAPFTGGVTLVPAIAMSVGQGIAGANNMYQNGATINNMADIAGGVLAAPGKMVAKSIMKTVGKSAKYVKRAPLLTKSRRGITAIKPLWQMAKENKKYTPYAGYVYTNLGANVVQPVNDLKDNYQQYIHPYVQFNNNLKQSINQESKKRKKLQQGGNFQINNQQPQILQRYISLINQGIPQQAAFDTSHLSMIEDERPGKYYSFGRRASNLGGWTKNVTDSLTNGRYKNLQNVQNFNQFKQGLKQKNYNTRPAFYNVEMNRGRDKDKQIINQWNKSNGLPLVAGIFNNNINNV